MKKHIWLIIALIVSLSAFMIPAFASQTEQANAAIQYYMTDDSLIIRLNVIMAGEKAGDTYTINGTRFIYDSDRNAVGYEDILIKTDYTYSLLAKQGIEMLSGRVEGVSGKEISFKIEVCEESGESFTKAEINEILAQKDDKKKNYIVIFPKTSFSELKRDYPAAYSEKMEKKNALGYMSYNYGGSGFIVITPGDAYRLKHTAAHEAMHLLGVGDIGYNNVGASLANSYDIMRYSNFRSIKTSNIHIYMMLKADNDKKMCQWNDMAEELQKYAAKNGLHYTKD